MNKKKKTISNANQNPKGVLVEKIEWKKSRFTRQLLLSLLFSIFYFQFSFYFYFSILVFLFYFFRLKHC